VGWIFVPQLEGPSRKGLTQCEVTAADSTTEHIQDRGTLDLHISGGYVLVSGDLCGSLTSFLQAGSPAFLPEAEVHLKFRGVRQLLLRRESGVVVGSDELDAVLVFHDELEQMINDRSEIVELFI
jgi:hypothetical protein